MAFKLDVNKIETRFVHYTRKDELRYVTDDIQRLNEKMEGEYYNKTNTDDLLNDLKQGIMSDFKMENNALIEETNMKIEAIDQELNRAK